MKYIVFQDPSEQEHIIMFVNYLTHAEVAKAMEHFPSKILKPVSAGEIHMSDDCNAETYCYGSSTSLKLKSRGKEDTYLLKSTLRH